MKLHCESFRDFLFYASISLHYGHAHAHTNFSSSQCMYWPALFMPSSSPHAFTIKYFAFSFPLLLPFLSFAIFRKLAFALWESAYIETTFPLVFFRIIFDLFWWLIWFHHISIIFRRYFYSWLLGFILSGLSIFTLYAHMPRMLQSLRQIYCLGGLLLFSWRLLLPLNFCFIHGSGLTRFRLLIFQCFFLFFFSDFLSHFH